MLVGMNFLAEYGIDHIIVSSNNTMVVTPATGAYVYPALLPTLRVIVAKYTGGDDRSNNSRCSSKIKPWPIFCVHALLLALFPLSHHCFHAIFAFELA
jgi:hypothetical protein